MYRFIWIFNWLKYFSLVEVMNQNYSEILMKKVHSSINEVASCTILKMIQWTWDHGERPGLKEDDSVINKLQLFLRQTLMLIDICNAWTLIDEKSIINKSLKKCIFIKGNGSWGLWPCPHICHQQLQLWLNLMAWGHPCPRTTTHVGSSHMDSPAHPHPMDGFVSPD